MSLLLRRVAGATQASPSRSGMASPAYPHLSEVETPTFGKVALCLRVRNIAQWGAVGCALRRSPTPRPARARPGCPWMRPLVLLSGLSGSCVGRLNNARSSGRVRKRSSSLSSAPLYSGRCSASSSTAAPTSILRRVCRPGVPSAAGAPVPCLCRSLASLSR